MLTLEKPKKPKLWQININGNFTLTVNGGVEGAETLDIVSKKPALKIVLGLQVFQVLGNVICTINVKIPVLRKVLKTLQKFL